MAVIATKKVYKEEKWQNVERLFSANEDDTEILKGKNRDCLDWGK